LPVGCAIPLLSYALVATTVSGIAVSGVGTLRVRRSSDWPRAPIKLPEEGDICGKATAPSSSSPIGQVLCVESDSTPSDTRCFRGDFRARLEVIMARKLCESIIETNCRTNALNDGALEIVRPSSTLLVRRTTAGTMGVPSALTATLES
jgi:hypothetical protein